MTVPPKGEAVAVSEAPRHPLPVQEDDAVWEPWEIGPATSFTVSLDFSLLREMAPAERLPEPLAQRLSNHFFRDSLESCAGGGRSHQDPSFMVSFSGNTRRCRGPNNSYLGRNVVLES